MRVLLTSHYPTLAQFCPSGGGTSMTSISSLKFNAILVCQHDTSRQDLQTGRGCKQAALCVIQVVRCTHRDP